MDFGIARRLVETQTQSTTTRNEIAGTPAYMAPEQEAGQPVPQSDLFALGVCAYEMISGHRPFDPRQGLMPKIESRFVPLSQSAAGLPAKIDAVIARALSPKAIERHRSAGEFLAELENALA
jgi:serine/threonine-protein kinase